MVADDQPSDTAPRERPPPPKRKRKRKRAKKGKKPMRMSTHTPRTLEEELPPAVPFAKFDGKAATLKLDRDYWPNCMVENQDINRPNRLLAGSIVKLPIEEARRLVRLGIGALVFEDEYSGGEPNAKQIA